MNYSFKTESDFQNGYLIKRRDTSSFNNPWETVARVDSGKVLTFFITSKHEKEEIEHFATVINII